MNDHILRVTQHRADLLASIEYLEGMTPKGDPEEMKAHASALVRARRAYHYAEQEYNNATATLSDRELELLGLAARPAA